MARALTLVAGLGISGVVAAQPDRAVLGDGVPARVMSEIEAPRIRRPSPGGADPNGPVVQVELPLLRGRRTVALSGPVAEVEVYEIGDYAFLLVYGGRNDGELVFHVVDRRTGLPERIVRPGAIRLPSDFVGTPGSAPLVLPDGVFLLAWDEGEVLRFRIHNASVPVGGAGLEVPIEAAAVKPRFDARRRRIELAFLGRDDSVLASFEFPHPIAPISTLSVGSELDFGRTLVGERRSRRILLRNEGDFPLHGFLSVSGPGFEWSGSRPSQLEIEPGGFTILGIDWTPVEAGSMVGELRLDAEVPTESRVVRLVGRSLAAAVEADGPPAVPGDGEGGRTQLPDDRVEVPDLRQSAIRWLEPGWIEVRGRLGTPAATVLAVEGGRDQSLTVAIDEAGGFRSILPCRVGDRIRIHWLGDDRRIDCGRVEPTGFLDGDRVRVEVWPGAVVALVELLDAPGGRTVEGRSFLRRADALGRVAFSVDERLAESGFSLKARGSAGRWVDLPLIEIRNRVR